MVTPSGSWAVGSQAGAALGASENGLYVDYDLVVVVAGVAEEEDRRLPVQALQLGAAEAAEGVAEVGAAGRAKRGFSVRTSRVSFSPWRYAIGLAQRLPEPFPQGLEVQEVEV